MPGQCPKCSKTVYFAEERLALGKAYHKMCVKCTKCNRLLDSSLTEHKGEMFCKSCYGRLFGPKGYGVGIGAGVLSMDDGTSYENGPPTSNVPETARAYVAPLKQDSTGLAPPGPKPKWGGALYCPRCSKSVFMAERVNACGKAWHKACFKCKECHKRIDSHNLRERESDIYCNACYGRNFGPKGYNCWSVGKVDTNGNVDSNGDLTRTQSPPAEMGTNLNVEFFK